MTGQVGGFVNSQMNQNNANAGTPVQQQATLGTQPASTYTQPYQQPVYNNNYGYQQPQYNYQNAANYNYLAGIVSQQTPAILQSLVNSYDASPQEINQISQALRNPIEWQDYVNRVVSPYLGMPSVNPNEITTNARNLLVATIKKIRSMNIPVMYGQNYNGFGMGMNNGFGNPGVPMYNNANAWMNTAPNYTNMVNYQNQMSTVGQPRNSMSSNYDVPAMSGVNPITQPTPNNPAPANKYIGSMTTAPKAAVHTGRAEDIDIDWNDAVKNVTPPKWEDATPSELEKSLDDDVAYLESFRVTLDKTEVSQENYALSLPTQSRVGAMCDVLSANPDIAKETFAHRVTHNNLIFCHQTMYEQGKSVFDTCRDILNDTKYKGVEAIRKIINTLNGGGTGLLPVIGEILNRFNAAASVHFVKSKGNGEVLVLNEFKNLKELDKFLIDSGSPEFAVWKEEKALFAKALTNCLKASFGTIFRPDADGYVDIEDDKQVAIVAADERTVIRLEDGTPGRLVFAGEGETRAKHISEFKKKLSEKFVVKLENRTIFHNIDDLVGKIDKGDYSLQMPSRSTSQLFLAQLHAKYGAVELVDISGEDQFNHPLILGMTYDGDVVLRRIKYASN